MGKDEIVAFLSWLASVRQVLTSTQNQALSALLFLYKVVLQVDLPWVGEFSRAKQAVRLPTVLSVQKAKQLLQQMDGITGLVAHLRYGTGMRLWRLRLRVKAARQAIYTSPMNDWFDLADSTDGHNTYHG